MFQDDKSFSPFDPNGFTQPVRGGQMGQDPFLDTPFYTPGPTMPAPQEPRPPKRNVGGRILFSLALLIVLGIGLFAGWQFTMANRAGTGNSATTTGSSSTTSILTKNGQVIDTTSSIETQQEQTIASVEPSVVELQVTTNNGEAIGSGVIIDTNGDIVTNNHVVSGAQSIVAVLSDGRNETAQLMGTAPGDDLAVVHIQPFQKMIVAKIGDSSKVIVGQEVLAIGNPLGITETATSGIVSALNRSVQESQGVTINDAIQTDAPINPGNSGGALVTLNGELIGIPTLSAVNTESNTPANNIGFAISSNLVKAALKQILQ